MRNKSILLSVMIEPSADRVPRRTIGSIVITMYLPLFSLIGKLSGGGK